MIRFILIIQIIYQVGQKENAGGEGGMMVNKRWNLILYGSNVGDIVPHIVTIIVCGRGMFVCLFGLFVCFYYLFVYL